MKIQSDQDFHLKAVFHVGVTDTLEYRSTVHLVFSCGERVLSRSPAYPPCPQGGGSHTCVVFSQVKEYLFLAPSNNENETLFYPVDRAYQEVA